MKNLFLLIIVFAVIGCYDNKLNENCNKELQSQQKRLNDIKQNNFAKFYNEQQNENFQLDKVLKLITVNRDTVFAKDLFKTNTLVLSYRESNCRMCIDAELSILVKNAQKINNTVCIIASYENFRGVIVDKRNLDAKGLKNIEIYYLSPNELKIPMEKQNMPYYFQIDSKLTMSNLFIPKKEKPKLSEIYLQFFLKNHRSNE